MLDLNSYSVKIGNVTIFSLALELTCGLAA